MGLPWCLWLKATEEKWPVGSNDLACQRSHSSMCLCLRKPFFVSVAIQNARLKRNCCSRDPVEDMVDNSPAPGFSKSLSPSILEVC